MSSPSQRKRTYQFGKYRLSLQFGDITDSKAEVIVSSDDYYLTMGGGVSMSIRRAAGDSILLDTVKKVPAELGDVIVTAAGALPAQYIFHAITIGPHADKVSAEEVLSRTVSRCFDLLQALRLNSIAFPAIGAGSAGFNYEDVAIHMAEIIAQCLSTSSDEIHATIYLYDRFGRRDPLDYIAFFEEFRARQPDLTAQVVDEGELTPTEEPFSPEPPAEDPRARGQQFLRSIALLDEERNRLEDELARIGDIEDDVRATEIRQRLNEIQDERIREKSRLQRLTLHTIEVFFSYAHEDEELRNELAKHLRILQRQGTISAWHDRKITAGSEWKGEIDAHLESAQIILLLISADFLASDYCYDVEMKRALDRHERKEAIVIPVILRPVSWSGAPFAKLQALPKDAEPVTTWTNQDAAFLNISEGIRDTISMLASQSNLVTASDQLLS